MEQRDPWVVLERKESREDLGRLGLQGPWDLLDQGENVAGKDHLDHLD